MREVKRLMQLPGGSYTSSLVSDLDHGFPGREKLQRIIKKGPKYCLQSPVGEIAAGDPKYLWGCPQAQNKIHEITVLADNYRVALDSCCVEDFLILGVP